MILVVLGTWKMPFVRPLLEIEKLMQDGWLNDEVIVQSGNTPFISKYLQCIPFFKHHELEKKYQQAKTVICQAGVGSIMLGLRNGKTVISIARKQKHNEHIDNHQEEILELFSKQNYVLKWQGNGDLKDVLTKLDMFHPSNYPFAEEKISEEIITFINKTVNK